MLLLDPMANLRALVGRVSVSVLCALVLLRGCQAACRTSATFSRSEADLPDFIASARKAGQRPIYMQFYESYNGALKFNAVLVNESVASWTVHDGKSPISFKAPHCISWRSGYTFRYSMWLYTMYMPCDISYTQVTQNLMPAAIFKEEAYQMRNKGYVLRSLVAIGGMCIASCINDSPVRQLAYNSRVFQSCNACVTYASCDQQLAWLGTNQLTLLVTNYLLRPNGTRR
jgi:hypothetical protein